MLEHKAARMQVDAIGNNLAAMDFYLFAGGQWALTRAGKIPARRGINSPSEDIARLLDSANLHVLRTEGDYSRYMKLYNEVLATR